MKPRIVALSSFGIAAMLFLFAYKAMAQVAGMPADLPDAEAIQLIVASLGGMAGASALAIAGAVVQIIVAILRSNLMNNLWSKIPGIWKIVSIVLLTAVSGVLAMVTQGVSVGAALIHSTTLSLLMIAGNQIYQHLTAPKPPAA